MIRLLLVDDQSLVCQGLQAMLDQVEDLGSDPEVVMSYHPCVERVMSNNF